MYKSGVKFFVCTYLANKPDSDSDVADGEIN